MSDYWKHFYDLRLKSIGDDPFVQVGRTLNKKAMDEDMFHRTARRFIDLLKLDKEHFVLDFCCGNGLFTRELALQSASVVGVDFNEDLISGMVSRTPDNVSGIVADALEVSFPPDSFHRIFFAASLQHFSQSEVVKLFCMLKSWLKPEGIILITDIPDGGKIWHFYDDEEREDVYFKNTLNKTPILGNWFDREWLQKLARHTGFTHSNLVDQPQDNWHAHYRVDLLLYS